MTRIKICGLTRLEDLELAIELGVNAVGFVLEDSSPRYVGLAEVAGLLQRVPPYVASTAVMGPVQSGAHLASFNCVQAIGAQCSLLEASQCAVSVYRLGSDDEWPDQSDCDAILLDTHSHGQFGGTGLPIDLASAKRAMADAVVPVVVAGGLTPENVAAAVSELRPYAVDVSSGVESAPGLKDAALMREFVYAVREIDRTLARQ